MDNKVIVTIHISFYLWLAAVFLIIPFRWVLGWIGAVLIHELGHCFMLKLLKCPVQKIEIAMSGMRIHTLPMLGYEEILCAAAGPAAGILLVLTYPWAPALAICAFFQTVFNMFPVYPFDGGRIWRILLTGDGFNRRGAIRKMSCKQKDQRVQ